MTESRRLRLDEEARGVLRRVVESMGRRQLASINILGHCLKFVPEVDVKVEVAAELDLSLRLFRQVRAIYEDLGWTELESAVQDRVDEVPFPASRLEFGIAYYLMGVAERVAMEAYTESSSTEFAAIARSHVEAALRRPQPVRFKEYCADPTNRPHAQQFFDRWFAIAALSFGTPGSAGDRRALELELRTRSSAEMLAEFRERVAEFVAECRLELAADGE